MRRMRPRFEVVVSCPPKQVLQRLRHQVAQSYAPCTGAFYPHHAVLRIPEDRRHFWSPELSLDLEPHAEGTQVRGRFGPRPAVWSLFVFAYAGLAFFAFFGLMYGVAQWTLGRPPGALWVVPGALLLGGAVYGAALVGQRLGEEQMVLLRGFVDYALQEET